MKPAPEANFSASDLKKPGPILNAAAQGIVRIKRRDEVFVLMRPTQFDRLLEEAGDLRPKHLRELLQGYDAVGVKQRLGAWNADKGVGKETLSPAFAQPNARLPNPALLKRALTAPARRHR